MLFEWSQRTYKMPSSRNGSETHLPPHLHISILHHIADAPKRQAAPLAPEKAETASNLNVVQDHV